ncbi:MAG: hydrogen peroxide-inducible genes activator [Planctomycetota bacterium]|nr:MAG: hydrogen peroxide-inducible genes activator [Planctomycetota bacterium]
MPTLRQLEYLVAIADTRHFHKAAAKANVSQPTLSGQLKALEERLGAQLVERSRASVVMTETGEKIVAIARRMLRDAAEIRELAAGGRGALGGVLRIGLPPTIGPYLLPSVLPDLRKRYPGLKLYVREDLPQTLPIALGEGRYDLVIAPAPLAFDGLRTVLLFREPLYLAVSRDHPLAGRKRIRRSDLAGQDVLALGSGYQLHTVVVALCESCGARVRLDYEGTSLDMLREMVATGLGVSFFPGLYVKTVLARDKGLRTLRLSGKPLQRSVGIAWRKTSARSGQYMELAEMMRARVRRDFPDIDAP